MTIATPVLRPATTQQRITDVLARGRDWLDARGRPAWLSPWCWVSSLSGPWAWPFWAT